MEDESSFFFSVAQVNDSDDDAVLSLNDRNLVFNVDVFVLVPIPS